MKYKNLINGFGKEWEKFDNEDANKKELQEIFNNYFKIFPKKFFNKKNIGIDVGSGSGRWSKFVAKKVKKIYLLDPSKKAIDVSKKKLKKLKNISYLNIEIKDLEKHSLSLDFAYSLGVIHHLGYPNRAFKIIYDKLKKNSPFLVYLYHNLETYGKNYYFFWKFSEFFRKIISKQNFLIKSFVCDFIALVIYYPLSRTSLVLDKLNINTKNVPLSYYKNKSFYVMRNDSLDRFGTKYEKRYSQQDIIKLFKKNGFKNIKISKSAPYWCAIGYKS